MTLTPSLEIMKKYATGDGSLAEVELSQNQQIRFMFFFLIPKRFVFQWLEPPRRPKKSSFTLGDPHDQKVKTQRTKKS